MEEVSAYVHPGPINLMTAILGGARQLGGTPLRGNDYMYWSTKHATHMEVWHDWRQHIRNVPLLPMEQLSSPRDDCINWYQEIIRVYIGNLACHDTRTYGYQPAGVKQRMMTSMLHEVDDMTTGCWRDYHRLQRGIQEPLPERGARGLKKGQRRVPHGGAHRRLLYPLHLWALALFMKDEEEDLVD
ncbi:hypothetical protein M9H77_04430 [Catharanthus roseus]|uniref:Uncharacterized protein n=1 Tax=Catharanthus roseus TaxID=4058 RepID=A0ACC0CED1_CATRO|nr:hypothetical protein M9H77_04430 [Catharanthus roseus]